MITPETFVMADVPFIRLDDEIHTPRTLLKKFGRSSLTNESLILLFRFGMNNDHEHVRNKLQQLIFHGILNTLENSGGVQHALLEAFTQNLPQGKVVKAEMSFIREIINATSEIIQSANRVPSPEVIHNIRTSLTELAQSPVESVRLEAFLWRCILACQFKEFKHHYELACENESEIFSEHMGKYSLILRAFPEIQQLTFQQLSLYY